MTMRSGLVPPVVAPAARCAACDARHEFRRPGDGGERRAGGVDELPAVHLRWQLRRDRFVASVGHRESSAVILHVNLFVGDSARLFRVILSRRSVGQPVCFVDETSIFRGRRPDAPSVFRQRVFGVGQREHGVGRRRVAHELAGLRFRIAILVQRCRDPAAGGAILVAAQPLETFGNSRIGASDAGFLQRERRQGRRIPVASSCRSRCRPRA